MPDRRHLRFVRERATRIDIAERLDAALDSDRLDGAVPGEDVLALPAADPVSGFLSLATEIREALHRPVLSPAERARIHDRALDIAEAHGTRGLRRAWPQLAQRAAGVHPALIGGAAAAVLAAAVGVAALQRRGHGGSGTALQAA